MIEKKWIAVTIRFSPESMDHAVMIFMDHGCIGILEDDPSSEEKQVTGYFESETAAEKCLSDLDEQIKLFSYPRMESLKDPGWRTAWHRYFHPVQVGKMFVIHPPWEPVSPSARIPLEINPGQAFGTGYHETTRLCIRFIERCGVSGCRLLDAGCGSGILGIAATFLGAAEIIGVDMDPVAVEECLINAGRNLSDGTVRWVAGTLECIRPGRYDGILANLNRPTLLASAQVLTGFLRPGGFLIISGFLRRDADIILAAFREQALTVVDTDFDGEWMAAWLRRTET